MEKENHAFTRSKWDVAEQQLSSFRAAQDNVFNFHTRLQQLQVRTESDRGLFFVSVCFVLICSDSKAENRTGQISRGKNQSTVSSSQVSGLAATLETETWLSSGINRLPPVLFCPASFDCSYYYAIQLGLVVVVV